MRVVWLEDRQLCLRDDLPVPVPAAGEALVRVRQAGICNTDLELVKGYYPFRGVLGHEFVGEVDGQRVVGEINARPPGCDCAPCQRGDVTHCDRRTVLGILNRDGAFAEYLTLPAENLHRVPESVPDEAAVFTEPLAAACAILTQVTISPQQRVLVIGPGKLGLLCAQVLALTGCALTVVGRRPETLALPKRLGLETALVESLGGLRADVVVECTGNTEGFAIARRHVRPRGTLVIKSTYTGTLTVDASRLVVDEIRVVGSRCGPFDAALRLLAGGRVSVTPLIADRYPLDQALTAFKRAQQPGVHKVLLATVGA
jgi:threonine dehydrogenase-like Zn-dependent dehydrogenase